MGQCPVCQQELERSEFCPEAAAFFYACPRCGPFFISRRFTDRFPEASLTARQRGNISAFLRENRGFKIETPEVCQYLRSLRTPGIMERAMKLLRILTEHFPEPGEPIQLRNSFRTGEMQSRCWVLSEAEMVYLFDQVLTERLQYLESYGGGVSIRQISPAGWVAVEEMAHPATDPSKCFVAMWFDPSVTVLFDQAIHPAANAAGYEAERVDRLEHNNRIDDEILAGVRRGKFLIADFTQQRPSVYFEAGFALGLGKPVIWLVREAEIKEVHFDNRQYNFLVWKDAELDDLRHRLHLRIEATLGRGPLPS